MTRSQRRHARECAFNRALRLTRLFQSWTTEKDPDVAVKLAYRYFKNRKPCSCMFCQNRAMNHREKWRMMERADLAISVGDFS